jgi:hypothetical protein
VSPLLGPAGNVEFLIHLRREADTDKVTTIDAAQIDAKIEAALATAQELRRKG